MLTHANLVDAVNRHLEQERISPTAFGRKVARDPNLVFDLRGGRSPQLRLIERILAEIHADNQGVAA
jgi:2,4-dienoyl-CoA reductase-like NADH-dependent reductase (Old Yellow Enzyme family)